MADLERTDAQSIDAAERHLAGVRYGDDDAGNGIDEDACLTGDPAEELLEVVAVENGLGQSADRLNVAIDSPGRSGLLPPHGCSLAEGISVRMGISAPAWGKVTDP